MVTQYLNVTMTTMVGIYLSDDLFIALLFRPQNVSSFLSSSQCLANTPAAINGNELRLVGIDVLIQQLLFLLPANKKLVHHHTIFDAAKVQIKTYTTKQNARNRSRMYIFGYVRDRFRAFMPLYSS